MVVGCNFGGWLWLYFEFFLFSFLPASGCGCHGSAISLQKKLPISDQEFLTDPESPLKKSYLRW